MCVRLPPREPNQGSATSLPALCSDMAMVPAAGAMQQQLGDDDERQAKQLALQRDAETRLAALGTGGIQKPKDTLAFLNNLVYKKVGGQQLTGNCMWCNKAINSTGATKVVDHFAICMLCPRDVKQACTRLREGTVAKRQDKQDHNQLVVAEQGQAELAVKKQKLVLQQQGIKAGFSNAEAAVADAAIAKFFYANGLNFGAADSAPDSYYRDMVRAIKAAPLGYQPPTAKTLSNRLLDETHESMLQEVAKRDADGARSPARPPAHSAHPQAARPQAARP